MFTLVVCPVATDASSVSLAVVAGLPAVICAHATLGSSRTARRIRVRLMQ